MPTKLLLITLIYFGMAAAKNLALITWEHGVNSKTKLENSLKSDIQMLEADVQLGNLSDSSATNVPIMAHPPAKVSDLSLEQFLSNVTEHNAKHAQHKKTIKLDFKTFEAFNASLTLIRSINNDVPFWLNADIFRGPGNPQSLPVDADKFLASAKQFPNATLSVGWTTNYDQSTSNATYTADDVALMLNTLQKHGVKQAISFPVRAVYAAGSVAELRELIANCTGASLTVWSAENDGVNVKRLQKMLDAIGLDKIYVDVPKMLMDQLDLKGMAARSATAELLTVVFSAFLLLFNHF